MRTTATKPPVDLLKGAQRPRKRPVRLVLEASAAVACAVGRMAIRRMVVRAKAVRFQHDVDALVLLVAEDATGVRQLPGSAIAARHGLPTGLPAIVCLHQLRTVSR
jgi:hypothetical protein